MDPPQTPVSPVAPSEALVATTDEAYLKFRILIVGRSGVGKSSLINTIFKAPLAEVQHDKAGAANINEGITSPYNKHLILHDSEGYEPGEEEKFRILEKFITEQTQKQSPTERLHAIWLCIPASYSGGRLFERGEEKIFKLNRNKVPIVVVITKFDLYVAGMQRRLKNKISYPSAEDDFKKKYGHKFAKNNTNQGQTPYALVSKTQFDTYQRLVQITRESISTETPGASSGHGRGSDEDRSGSAQIALATAQRVDMPGKIEASIKVGKKKYWTAIGTGIPFFNASLEKCLKAIHKDIVTIWNIRDLHDYLLGDAFHRRMMVIVEDLKDAANTMQSKVTVTSAMAGLAKLWTNSLFKEGPEHMRCLMGYVVDLTLILQAIFQDSLRDQSEGKVTPDSIDEIIYEFHCSEKKKDIHDAIRKSIETRYLFAKNDVVNEIASLIDKNKMTEKDTKLDRDRSTLLLLLPILRFELTANGLVVNQTILGLVRELLVLPNFRGIGISDLDRLDVELLLDFILYLLQNNRLSSSGIPNANRKARQLMFKLISEADVIPKSLYITDVTTDLSAIGAGGYGRVLRGNYGQISVALKVIEKAHKDINHEFCQEALAWRSLAHPYILPLLGIFRDGPQLFLVSPCMENGTLSDWRAGKEPPALSEIHRVMLEVAEGVRYIHSEGIVHGDLKGENILLDANLHCRIVDFGLTRHSDATATGNVAFSIHFAAPELFGKCVKCGDVNCDGSLPGHEIHRKKTMETDVYAFGCLYYSIFYNTIPFGKGSTFYRVSWLVINEKRPDRLETPKIEDKVWKLIENCWKPKPSDRPKMEQIVSSFR